MPLPVSPPSSSFLPYAEAAALVQRLGVQSIEEYRQVYRRHAGLPSTPNMQYSADWPGWPGFLNRTTRMLRFVPYQRAQAIARAEGWKTARAYQAGYRRYPGLPGAPQQIYADQWKGWPAFLAQPLPSPRLPYPEAVATVRAAHLRTSTAYAAHYKEYPGLPQNPVEAYADQWQGWRRFLWHEDGFFTFAEAQAYVIHRQVRHRVHYLRLVREEVRLPQVPERIYRSEWPGWPAFFGRGKTSVR
jgi:hypothetical protein